MKYELVCLLNILSIEASILVDVFWGLQTLAHMEMDHVYLCDIPPWRIMGFIAIVCAPIVMYVYTMRVINDMDRKKYSKESLKID